MSDAPDIYSLLMGDDPTAQQQAMAMAQALRRKSQDAGYDRGLAQVSSMGANPLLAGLAHSSMAAANQESDEANQGQQMLAGAAGHRLMAALNAKKESNDAGQFDRQLAQNLLLKQQDMANDRYRTDMMGEIAGKKADAGAAPGGRAQIAADRLAWMKKKNEVVDTYDLDPNNHTMLDEKGSHELRTMAAAKNYIDEQVNNIQGLLKATPRPVATDLANIQAQIAGMKGKMIEAEGLHPSVNTDKLMEEMIRDPGSLSSYVMEGRLPKLLDTLQKEVAISQRTKFAAYGKGVGKDPRTATVPVVSVESGASSHPDAGAAAEWAKANPTNPMAAKILAALSK